MIKFNIVVNGVEKHVSLSRSENVTHTNIFHRRDARLLLT